MNIIPAAPLPAAVTGYFAAVDGMGSARVALELFIEDAVVEDDGHTYRGIGAIAGWLSGAASAFEYTSTRVGVSFEGATVTVLTRLEGNFPGGMVELRNVFTLTVDGRIRRLVIAP